MVGIISDETRRRLLATEEGRAKLREELRAKQAEYGITNAIPQSGQDELQQLEDFERYKEAAAEDLENKRQDRMKNRLRERESTRKQRLKENLKKYYEAKERRAKEEYEKRKIVL